MKLAFLTIASTFAVSTGLELTPDNWDEHTTGKSVFLKFYAPWCGHCKAMKPDWDKLMTEYEGSETTLIAEVDCTGDGKPLCEENGVQGFPTIKYGSPLSLEDYKGGRDGSALESFAKTLRPFCNPLTRDNCNDEEVALLDELKEFSIDELEKDVQLAKKGLADAETEFENNVKQLQEQYSELTKKKEETTDKLKEQYQIPFRKATIALLKKEANGEL